MAELQAFFDSIVAFILNFIDTIKGLVEQVSNG